MAFLLKRSMTKKKISLVLCLFFLLQTAAPYDCLQAAIKRPSHFDADTLGKQKLDINSIDIPLRLGEIRDYFQGSSGKTVLHITDAHCNYSAQHAIARIIGYLNTTYGVDLVALEGGSGDYDLSVFTGILNPDLRSKVADYFVKEGEVNGAELFGINHPKQATLYGIENARYYLENLNIYKNSLTTKEDTKICLDTLSHVIANLKPKIYSAALLKQEENAKAFKDKKLKMKPYVRALSEAARTLKIDVAAFKNVNILLHIMKDEERIDFKKAQREKSKLIDKITEKLSKKRIEELVQKSLAFKKGDLLKEEYFSYLFKRARFCGVRFKEMPNLVLYSAYVKEYESVRKKELLKEIAFLQEATFDRLFENNEQRTLYGLDKKLTIVKGMFAIVLRKEDWDYYSTHKTEFQTALFLRFFRKECPRYGLDFKIDDALTRLDSYRELMEQFFVYSFKRDDAFIENIEKELTKNKKDVTILVTGGFHKDNLKQLFKGKGYSYLEIFPKFKTKGDTPYFKLLSGGADPIVETLLAGPSTIQIASYLNPLGAAVYSKEQVKAFRDAVRIMDAFVKNGYKPMRIPIRNGSNSRVITLEGTPDNIKAAAFWVTDIDAIDSTLASGRITFELATQDIITRTATSGRIAGFSQEQARLLKKTVESVEITDSLEFIKNLLPDKIAGSLASRSQETPHMEITVLGHTFNAFAQLNAKTRIGFDTFPGKVDKELTDKELEYVKIAIILHDIGKIFAPRDWIADFQDPDAVTETLVDYGYAQEDARAISSKLTEGYEQKSPQAAEYPTWSSLLAIPILREMGYSRKEELLIRHLIETYDAFGEYMQQMARRKNTDPKRMLARLANQAVLDSGWDFERVLKMHVVISSADISSIPGIRESYEKPLEPNLQARFNEAYGYITQAVSNMPAGDIGQLASSVSAGKVKTTTEEVVAPIVGEGKREELLTVRASTAGARQEGARVRTVGDITELLAVKQKDAQSKQWKDIPFNPWIRQMFQSDKANIEQFTQGYFNDKKSMITIPIADEDWSKVIPETYLGKTARVRAGIDSVVVRYNLGKNISIYMYRDNKQGRHGLMKKIEESGVENKKRRVVTFASKDAEGNDHRELIKLNDTSYVVYLDYSLAKQDGEEGGTAVPIGHAGMTGLAILNYFSLQERTDDEEFLQPARESIASSLAALAGQGNFDELLKRIEEEGLLNLSGKIMIQIRPIDTNEIREFHEAEMRALKAL